MRIVMRTALISALVVGVLGAAPASFAETTGDGPAVEPRVVNGTRVDPSVFRGDWGFTVALVAQGLDPGQGQFCAGTLIAQDVVVTAAHCVASEDEGEIKSFFVYYGSHSLIGRYPPGAHVGVAAIVVHPQYDGFANDIAVLRLAEPIDAPTAPLPPGDSVVPAGIAVSAAGWGCSRFATEPGEVTGSWTLACDTQPPVLHEATLTLREQGDCQLNFILLGPGFDIASQRCAGAVSPVGGAPDVCFGDSGGPLIVRTATGPLLAGIVASASGVPCGYYPSIYTDVVALRGFVTAAIAITTGIPAVPIAAVPAEPDAFVLPGTTFGTINPLTPARLIDTRETVELGSGIVRTVKAAGYGGVPVTGAGSVLLNVTVVDASRDGYLTVYPCGSTAPLASNLNYATGQTVANAVQVGLSDEGDLCVVSFAATDVVIDVAGWASSELEADAPGSRLTPLVPQRLLDTRSGAKPEAREIVRVDLRDLLDSLLTDDLFQIPSAVSLNLTATEADGDGFLTAFPCGDVPLASNVNYGPGAPASNAVTVPVRLAAQDLGLVADICVYTYAPTHVVVDITGWYGLPRAVRGGRLAPVTPTRLIDTRTTERIAVGETRRVPILGQPGVPAGTTGAVVNVTAVDPSSDGYLTTYPCGSERPGTSTVNHGAGDDVPTLAVVPVGADGGVCVFAYAETDIVVDLTGYLAP